MGDQPDAAADGALPLRGCTVIDVSSYVTGPFAAMMLADLGADVLKVEPPGGDPNRRFGHLVDGTGMLFANTNRAKRSCVLDLKSAEDLGRLQALLASADVLVENWRPGVAERLGLDDGALAVINPSLVHLAITGYGPSGPLADRGAFDSAVQAISGLAWHNRHDGAPELSRTYLVDKVTACFGVQGVLGALLRRDAGHGGGRVEVDMLDSAAYFNFPDVFEARTVVSDATEVRPEDNPGLRTLIPTSDGHVVVAPSTGSHVRRACEAVGHPEWVAQLKERRGFADLAPELMRRLTGITRTDTTAHWLEVFDRHDVPVAPVLDLDQHLAHPQVVHNGTYRTVRHAVLGEMRAPRHPATPRLARTGDVALLPFPDLDQHGPETRAAADRSVGAPR